VDLRPALDAIRPAVVQITVTAEGLSKRAVAKLGGHGTVFSRPVGTGFFVGSSGAVVTANHVLDGVPEWEARCRAEGATWVHVGVGVAHLMVGARRGTFTVGSYDIVATDALHDLAVLRLRKNPFSGELRGKLGDEWVPLVCDAARLQVERPEDGLPVACSGYPLQSFVLVTNAGIVASSWSVDLKQLSLTAPEDVPDIYLADMQINGGNSGGPVYSALNSAVIGVAVASRVAPVAGGRGMGQDAGLALVVPSKYIVDLLDAHGVEWDPPG
jgi:S1-C subfamily serine protease